MSPKRLQNKIERLLAELRQNCPKRYNDNTWTTWIDSKNSKKILTTYKAEYLDAGASRMAIAIPHAGKTYVFKVVFATLSDNVVNGEAEDDNHAEIKAVLHTKKSIWTRSLVLPMVTYFHNKHVGWVSVWPKVTEYDYYDDVYTHHTDRKYNEFRYGLIEGLTSDAHGGNVGYWKGYLWLIDFNLDDCQMNHERIKKTHKRYAPKYRKAYREASKLVKSFD